MQLLQRFSVLRVLHQRQLLFPVVVAVAVMVVLAQGWWQQRAQGSGGDAAPPVPVEPAPPRPRFASLEKAPLAYFSEYWTQLADRAAGRLVPIGPDRVTGIVVEPNVALMALEAAPPFDGGASATASETPTPDAVTTPATERGASNAGFRLLGADIESGLALVEFGDSIAAEPFTLNDATALRTGELVASVSLGPEGRPQLTPGSFVAVRQPSSDSDGVATIDLALNAPDRMTAIVDLDGNLIGVWAPGTTGAIAAAAVPTLVDRMREGGPCRAIVVSDLSEPVRAALSLEEGVVVERIHDEAFRTPPGVWPGDVLLAWRDEVVASADAFDAVYQTEEPGSEVPYRFMRGRRRMTGVLIVPGSNCRPTATAPVHLLSLGVTVEPVRLDDDDERSAWRIAGVDAGTPAAEAGFVAGDVIIAINGAPLTDDRFDTLATRLERRPRAIVVSVGRRGGVTLVALPAIAPE